MQVNNEALNSWIFDHSVFRDLHGGNSSSSDSSDEDDDLPEPTRAPRSLKARYSVQDRYNSLFFNTYLSQEALQDGVRNDDSYRGKKFRRRFRVPYSIFLEICDDLKRTNKVADHGKDATGAETVCTDLLVLGSLRVMGSGCTFDVVEELTNVHEETHRVFFHEQFCKWGDRVSSTHISMPTDLIRLRHIMGLYERLGLPGCAGSVDCVHLVWDRCPAGLGNVCRGKDKVPTLAFQVVASHTKKILSVSQYFWGTVNDKTISRADQVFNLFRDEGGNIATHKWHTVTPVAATDSNNYSNNNLNNVDTSNYASSLTTSSVLTTEHTGAYMICDGGYHQWPCLMFPFKHQPAGTDLEMWSSQIESVRKDVECVFGILKKRFLFLKHPIRIASAQKIERVFVTCCVLHNLLIDYDGMDNWNWNDEDVNVEYNVPEDTARLRAENSVNCHGVAGLRSARREEYGVGEDEYGVSDVCLEEREAFHERRLKLIQHFRRMYNARALRLGS